MIAGTPWPRGNFSVTSSRARRDSESLGRKSSWLLVVTSPSGGAATITTTPTMIHATITAAARRQLAARLASSPNIDTLFRFTCMASDCGTSYAQIVKNVTKSPQALDRR